MDTHDIRVVAVGTALPGPPVDNATLVRRFGMPAVWEQWIDAFVGTDTRHFARNLETGEVRYSLTDLCETAGRRALTAAGLTGADIDLVVLGTATPDLLMPSTACLVADRLGIDGVPAYQMQSGCTGALQALDVAAQALAGGRCRTALVLGADTSAHHLDLDLNLADAPPEVQVNAMLFGDGAGAAVLDTRPGEGSPVLRHVSCKLVGLGREPGQVIPWYGPAERIPDELPVSEDFKGVEQSAGPMAERALADLLDLLEWKRTEIDYLLPPQLSGRMTKRVVDALDMDGAKVVSRVTEIGNTANALPFFQLERLLPLLEPGDRAVGLSVEASKWIQASYAVEMPGSDLQDDLEGI
jgi:3-oxoacyl-[acyl-carrier-protein] synthase-3